MTPPHDVGISKAFDEIKTRDNIRTVPHLDHPLIEEIEDEIDQAYMKALTDLQCQPELDHKFGHKLSLIYTSLHGTGSTLLPKLLNDWGFTDLSLVQEQCIPDGNFSTVSSPNPEDKKKALSLGIEMMIAKNADILLATDPDADRVGVAVLHQGIVHILSGNQIAALLADHVFSHMQDRDNSACIKSIVTTELFRKIADHYHVQCFDVLPGFKYIAEKIHLWEGSKASPRFILGAEESFGYLYGTQSRDKDALIASLLISEIALTAKLNDQTIIDKLHELYQTWGLFVEKQHTVQFDETKEGKERMKKAMDTIANNPPLTLHGKKAVKIGNLQKGEFLNIADQSLEKSPFPPTNMIILYYEGDQTLMIRPSGTEPKIKIYLMLKRNVGHSVESAIEAADQETAQIFDELSAILKR